MQQVTELLKAAGEFLAGLGAVIALSLIHI